MVEPKGDWMRFTLTIEERKAVVALKEACEEKQVEYKSIFELAKFTLAVHSQGKSDQKRTKLALKRLKKRRKWEAQYGIDQIDNMQALKEICSAAPGCFVVRYTTDHAGHNIVGHNIAGTPYDFIFADKKNLGKYLAVEQWRMELGAADLEEARRGMAVVGVADGQWGVKQGYRYLRVLTLARDTAKDMHPNRLRKVYAEIPVFAHHLIGVGMSLLPKKIASRVIVHHTVQDLEVNLCKAKEGKDPMTIIDWCKQHNDLFEESVQRVTL